MGSSGSPIFKTSMQCCRCLDLTLWLGPLHLSGAGCLPAPRAPLRGWARGIVPTWECCIDEEPQTWMRRPRWAEALRNPRPGELGHQEGTGGRARGAGDRHGWGCCGGTGSRIWTGRGLAVPRTMMRGEGRRGLCASPCLDSEAPGALTVPGCGGLGSVLSSLALGLSQHKSEFLRLAGAAPAWAGHAGAGPLPAQELQLPSPGRRAVSRARSGSAGCGGHQGTD